MPAVHLLIVLLAASTAMAAPAPGAWLDADPLVKLLAFKGPIRWSNCGDPSKQSFTATISPNPPVRGQQVKGTFSFVPDADLIQGKISLDLWYNGSPAIQLPYWICKSGTHSPYCPMKKGEKVTVSNSVAVPNYLQPGHYNGTAILLNQDNHQMLCIQAEGDLA